MMKRFLTLCLLFVFLLAMPVLAADTYVFDDAGLLTEMQRADLNEQCAFIEEYYACGVYMVTVNDYLEYGSTPYEAATNLYTQLGLGVDNSDMSDGVLLMLSMADRDYALICHGYYGNEVFDEDGRAYLEEGFLPDFAGNLWAMGFNAYVNDCFDLLATYEEQQLDHYGGDYESYYSPGTYGFGDRLLYAADYFPMILPGSAVIALIICLLMKRSMRTAREATHATEYIPRGGVDLRIREDRFTHTTTQVIHHERDTDSGSGGFSGGGGGGGFSGSSGKF